MPDDFDQARDAGPRPVVTVVVPVFNSADTLPRAVRSALGQTLRAVEVLVVDDGSTDDSLVVARALAAEDPRVRVLALSPNAGKSRAMNLAIPRARGDWVAILDADDAFDPERLARMVAAGEESGVEMVADNQHHLDGGAGVTVRTAFRPGEVPELLGKAEFLKGSDPLAEFDLGILKPMLRTDFVRRTGLAYHEEARRTQDFFYLVDFFVLGGRLRILPEPLYLWTLPFGPVSRRWTGTAGGPWRYHYDRVLPLVDAYVRRMEARGELAIAGMLRERGRRLGVMARYIEAQKAASERRWLASARILLRNPATLPLLARRVAGRAARALGRQPPRSSPA